MRIVKIIALNKKTAKKLRNFDGDVLLHENSEYAHGEYVLIQKITCPRIKQYMHCPECGFLLDTAKYPLDEKVPHINNSDALLVNIANNNIEIEFVL